MLADVVWVVSVRDVVAAVFIGTVLGILAMSIVADWWKARKGGR